MSLQTKFLLATAGLAIFLAGVFFGGPGHVFWPAVVGGLRIYPPLGVAVWVWLRRIY